jgi:predicted dehydrogenase
VLALADRHGVAVTVFQNRRWDGDFLTLRSAISAGALGSITRFESRFERWRPTVETTRWRESADPEHAGGVLADLGTHLVDQALVLFGRPTAVHAEVHTRRAGAVVDDDIFLALTFPGGIEAHLWASMACPIEGPRFRVLGTAAGFESWGLDLQEPALRAGLVPGGPGWAEATGGRTARIGEHTVPMQPGRYVAFYEQVADALTRRSPWPVDAADAIATQQVLEAALASARSRNGHHWPG